ncbi:MAG: hypothetical protein GKS04_04455 [Candidatus Mycalebacterium zealandia]|nr:MAG: hypothetical protein GKS04_04455 [Candidatus Mycalebacterium zealandia]
MRIFILFPLLCAVALVFGADVCSAQVSVVKVERSKPFPDARVRVVSPLNGESVRPFSPEVRLEVFGFKPGVQTETKRKNLVANSSKGQHVHLIVDNEPYEAIYDVSKPVVLKNLSVGPHTLVVFPSRSYHESIKSEGAAHVVNFNVVSSLMAVSPPDLSAPALIYSRPKGVYKDKDAESVMVDFYLRNTTLGPDGYKVKLFVFEGARASRSSLVALEVFEVWQPAFVTGLKSGKYTFLLELFDSRGNRVPGIFGSARRLIQVVRRTSTGG